MDNPNKKKYIHRLSIFPKSKKPLLLRRASTLLAAPFPFLWRCLLPSSESPCLRTRHPPAFCRRCSHSLLSHLTPDISEASRLCCVQVPILQFHSHLFMSSSFRVVCLLHAAVATVTGCLMMFYLPELARFGHGIEVTRRILGSTPHDQLLIRTSEALVGMCFVIIGLLLFMVSFSKDREFQSFFAKGCVLIHALMVIWRLNFERKVDDLAWAWPRQIVGDFLLGMSWVFLLGWNWREKYD